MMLILSAIAVVGGGLLGRWVAARHQPKAPEEGDPEASREEPRATEAGAVEATPGHSSGHLAVEPASHVDDVDWSAFPCALGDVVMRSFDGAEAWLAGAVVFREDALAAALFIAPDASGERVVYARSRPTRTLAWLVPVKRDAFAVGAEPPSAIEIDGARFERRRRLPLRAQRVGTGTPDITGTAVVGEYFGGAGEVALVVVADGVGRAWRGRELGEAEYEVWSGEKAREG